MPMAGSMGGGATPLWYQQQRQEEARRMREEEAKRQAAEAARQQAQKDAFNPTLDRAAQGWEEAFRRAQNGYQAGQIAEDPAQAQLRAVAMGQAPSVAQGQFQANRNQLQQQALGIAAGAHGAERAGLRMHALNQYGMQGAQLAGQAAALEAEERQRAAGVSSQLGLQRAMAQEEANRGAFGATTAAQLGALNTAQGFGGLGLQGAQGQVQADQFQQQLEMERKRQQQARLAQWLSFISGGGQVLATALGGPAAGAAVSAATGGLSGGGQRDADGNYLGE